MNFRSSKLTSVNHVKPFMRLLQSQTLPTDPLRSFIQSCTLPRDPLRPLLLRFEIFSGYTKHILYYAGVSIMPPRVLAKTLRGQKYLCGVTISVLKTAISMGPMLLVMIRLRVRGLQNRDNSLNVSA